MRWLLIALLVGLPWLGWSREARAQTIVCYYESQSSHLYTPASGNNFYYEASTQCPIIVDYIGVAAWAEKVLWNPAQGTGDWERTTDWPIAVAPNFFARLAAVSGELYVMPYFELNCRRIKSIHAANYGTASDIKLTISPAECY